MCYPLLRTERYPVRNALAIASVAVYPFLWSLGAHRGWHLGIVVVSIAFAWSVYWVLIRYRQQKSAAIVLILLLGGLLHVSVNWMVEAYLEWVIVSAVVLVLDVLCLGGAFVLEKSSGLFWKRT